MLLGRSRRATRLTHSKHSSRQSSSVHGHWFSSGCSYTSRGPCRIHPPLPPRPRTARSWLTGVLTPPSIMEKQPRGRGGQTGAYHLLCFPTLSLEWIVFKATWPAACKPTWPATRHHRPTSRSSPWMVLVHHRALLWNGEVTLWLLAGACHALWPEARMQL